MAKPPAKTAIRLALAAAMLAPAAAAMLAPGAAAMLAPGAVATLAPDPGAVKSAHPHPRHARHHHRHSRRHAGGNSAHAHPHPPPPPVSQRPASAGAVSAVPVPAQCADADIPFTAASAATMRAAVVCLVDQRRAAHGLPALSDSPQLDHSAQDWNDAMVRTGAFSHGQGDAFATRISDAGYDWQDAGENIATGFATPRTVVAAWMASEDHCRNILAPQFADVGTGVSPAPVAGFATTGATWTPGLWTSDEPVATFERHSPDGRLPLRRLIGAPPISGPRWLPAPDRSRPPLSQ